MSRGVLVIGLLRSNRPKVEFGCNMFKVLKVYLLLMFVAIVLSSCLTPGSNLSTRNKDVRHVGDDHCFSIACRVKVYEINPELIRQLYVSPPTARMNPRLNEQIKHYQYRIGVGDILNVMVWDHPELTIPAGQYRSAEESGNWVQADGSVFYPYIGKVLVANKTIPEVRNILSGELEKYIEKPQVSVNVAAFRSKKVYVTGEVNKQGQQPISNIPLTILDAINQAGGLTQKVDWRHVTLAHNGEKQNISLYALMQNGDLRQNVLLHNGDIIHVPGDDNQKIFVMGEVKQPQLLKIDKAGMSLSEALASAGGIIEQQANASGIFVIRPVLEGFDKKDGTIAHIFQLNMRDAAALVLGTEFTMRPYDVIYVTAAPLELWNRVVRQLLPTIGALNVINARSVVFSGTS